MWGRQDSLVVVGFRLRFRFGRRVGSGFGFRREGGGEDRPIGRGRGGRDSRLVGVWGIGGRGRFRLGIGNRGLGGGRRFWSGRERRFLGWRGRGVDLQVRRRCLGGDLHGRTEVAFLFGQAGYRGFWLGGRLGE